MFDIMPLLLNGISSLNNYTGRAIQKKKILGWLSLFRFCQGEKKDNKDMFRNEFCPLFSILIIQFFFNTNFKKEQSTKGCSRIGEYKWIQEWHSTQHEESFQAELRIFLPHCLLLTQVKEMHSPFTNLPEGINHSNSNFPKNLNFSSLF